MVSNGVCFLFGTKQVMHVGVLESTMAENNCMRPLRLNDELKLSILIKCCSMLYHFPFLIITITT